jgi:thiamine biosynthesis lipoprotein
LVAASGDIAAGDAPPGKPGWRVSVGAPVSGPARSGDSSHSTASAAGAPFVRTLLLKNSAVSTSGDAEQFVEIDGVRYSHIVNPHTGVGLTNQLQVTVVARYATDTDALATTVCVLGVERGLSLVESQPGVAALILQNSNGRLERIASRRLKDVPLAD